MPSTAPAYSRLQIGLHWLTAALVVVQVVFHESIVAAWDKLQQGASLVFDPLVQAHVLGGIALLGLVAWRLALRFRRAVPAAEGPAWLRRAAALGHLALYATLVGLGLSGLAAWFGGLEAAAELHEALKPVLLLLVAGHVAAALWHHFVRKDGTLARMR
ncbi:MAG: cytochrome b [Gemmobacter sp.]|uniref:cytochrome b n=1 Tax=Gemmobacter sp. TaxID=1898957 RepID=UPI00391CE473